MKRYLIIVIFFVLLLFGVGYFWFANHPSEGSIHEASKQELKQMLGEQAVYTSQVASKKKGIGVYNGTYFTFSYPASYNVKTTIKDKGTILEQLIISEPDVISKTLAITVAQTDAQSYGDLSGVSFREMNKASYKKSPIILSGKKGIVFESTTDGYEKSAFFLTSKRVYTIAFTSPSATALATDFSSLTSTIHWK